MDIKIRYGFCRCSSALTPPVPLLSANAGILQAANEQSSGCKIHDPGFKSNLLMQTNTEGPIGR